jgi:hypothetical protein
LVTFFGEAKKVTRPPGRKPGLVMTTVHACWVIRRQDVTAKQQLLLTLQFAVCSLPFAVCRKNFNVKIDSAARA